MYLYVRIFCVLLFFSTIVAVISAQEAAFWNADDDIEQTAADVIAKMTDEEIVAQVLLVGWKNDEIADLQNWISRRGIGGIKIFGWNGRDARALAQDITTFQELALKQKNSIPLFTATDQEGGWIRHVKDGTSITPGNMAIGASRLPHDAYQSAYHIGKELRAIGININFAPTVDVYIHPEAHVIGPRAFSSDPKLVGTMGLAYYKGLEQNRIISVAKHFPGHGNANGDSHGTLPVVSDTIEEIWDRDLLPYRMLIREGIPAVLIGHLSYPNIIGNNIPTTFSRTLMQKVLRQNLDFDGLIITDDLYMQGALIYAKQQNWSFAQTCLEAIRAGNDMIMLSGTPNLYGSIWNALIQAYKEDSEIREQINMSVQRIIRTKLRYLRPDNRVPFFPDSQEIHKNLSQEDSQQFFFEHAARSITLVRGDVPFRPPANSKVLLVGKDRSFHTMGRRRYGNAEHLVLSGEFYQPDESDRANFLRMAPNYDYIIFCLSDPASFNILHAAKNIETEIVVFSVHTPIYLEELPWIKKAIAVYGRGSASYEAGFAVLAGDYKPEGIYPLAREKKE